MPKFDVADKLGAGLLLDAAGRSGRDVWIGGVFMMSAQREEA